MIDRLFEAIAAALLTASVALGFVAVVARYGFGVTFSWSYEVLQGLLVYMTFFCAYLALRKGAHLRIDVIVSQLPSGAQLAVFVFNTTIMFAVALVMTIYGWEQTARFAWRGSLVLEAPMWLFYVVIPVAGAGLMLECVLQIARAVQRFRIQGNGPYTASPDEDDGARL